MGGITINDMILQVIGTHDDATKIYYEEEVAFSPMWEVAKPDAALEDSFAQLEISMLYKHAKKETIYRIYSHGNIQDIVALSAGEALEKFQGDADKIEYLDNKFEPIILAGGLVRT